MRNNTKTRFGFNALYKRLMNGKGKRTPNMLLPFFSLFLPTNHQIVI